MDWDGVKQWDNNQQEYWRGSVAGVTFVPNYPANLSLLKEQLTAAKPLDATIKRNPDNQYDSNAVEVWVKDQFIGHLARDVAKEIAPMMDAGKEFTIIISFIGASAEAPDKPGAVYHITPVVHH